MEHDKSIPQKCRGQPGWQHYKGHQHIQQRPVEGNFDRLSTLLQQLLIPEDDSTEKMKQDQVHKQLLPLPASVVHALRIEHLASTTLQAVLALADSPSLWPTDHRQLLSSSFPLVFSLSQHHPPSCHGHRAWLVYNSENCRNWRKLRRVCWISMVIDVGREDW